MSMTCVMAGSRRRVGGAPDPVIYEQHFGDDSDLANWSFTDSPGYHDPTVVFSSDPIDGAIVHGAEGDGFPEATRYIPVSPGMVLQATVTLRLIGPGLNTGDWWVKVTDASLAQLWVSTDLFGFSSSYTIQNQVVNVYDGNPLPANAAFVRFHFVMRGSVTAGPSKQQQIGYLRLETV